MNINVKTLKEGIKSINIFNDREYVDVDILEQIIWDFILSQLDRTIKGTNIAEYKRSAQLSKEYNKIIFDFLKSKESEYNTTLKKYYSDMNDQIVAYEKFVRTQNGLNTYTIKKDDSDYIYYINNDHNSSTFDNLLLRHYYFNNANNIGLNEKGYLDDRTHNFLYSIKDIQKISDDKIIKMFLPIEISSEMTLFMKGGSINNKLYMNYYHKYRKYHNKCVSLEKKINDKLKYVA